jgi:hypothetical protein
MKAALGVLFAFFGVLAMLPSIPDLQGTQSKSRYPLLAAAEKWLRSLALRLRIAINLKTAVEKAGQFCAALILLGDAIANCSHRTSPAG